MLQKPFTILARSWNDARFRVQRARFRQVLMSLVFLTSLVGMNPVRVVAAPAGTALQFNGSNQYVTFGEATSTLGVTNFTIEAWVNRASGGSPIGTGTLGLGTGSYPQAYPVVTKGRGEAETPANINTNYFIGIATTGVIAADFEDTFNGTNHPVIGNTTIPLNEWHHIAVSYDGQTWRLYLDGMLDNTTMLASPFAPEATSIQHAGIATAMNSSGAPSGYFAGSVDEVRIWNVVRSEAEIQADLYNELTSGSGLIGRWGLNEATGATAANSIAGSPDGALKPDATPATWVDGFPLPDSDPPDEPTNLVADPFSAAVKLTWTAPADPDVAGYNLYRSESTPVSLSSPINGGTLIPGTSYTDSGLVNGTIYYYVVTAVDTSTNESGASNEIDATPLESLGAALQFDGSNDYVTFGSATGLNATNFTIETWFNWTGGGIPTSTGTGGITAYPLVTKGRGESEASGLNVNYFLGIDGDVLAADFEAYSGGQNYPVTGTTSITPNTWHHAAATYDGTCWQLYLDGIPDTPGTTCPGVAPDYTSTQHAGIATAMTSSGVADGYFQGIVDEARIWNLARTQAEIFATINSEVTSGTGLIGRWGMNEGQGTVIDSSVGTIPGTLTNGPAWTVGAPFNIAPPTAPAAPSGLSATSSSSTSVDLSWVDNSDNETGFEVERGSALEGPFSPLDTVGQNTTSYADTDVQPVMEYCYRVRATNPGGTSDYSDVSCATTLAETPAALQFDGSNDYVTFGVAPGLGVTDFTLETWFYWTGGGVSMTTSGTQGLPSVIPLVSKGRGEADGDNRDMNYFLGIDTNTNALAVDFEDMNSGLNHPFVGTTPVTPNAWHHAAATYDSVTAVYTLYLDGNIAGTSDIGSNILPRADSIQHAGIASAMTSDGTPAGYFQGTMDEVRIWDYARLQTEIRDEINNEVTSGTGLVARWGLNEGSGTTISSSVGSFSGELTNGPVWVTPGAPFDIVFDTEPPTAPTGLTGIGANASVTLDWDDNAEGDLAGYNVYRGTTMGVYTRVNTALVTVSDYVDTGLTNGTEYFYVVRAVDTSANESGDSNEAYAIPMADLGSGLEFTTASGTYVTFGDPDKLDLAAFTIETWFKRTGAGTAITTGGSGIPNAIPLVAHGAQQSEGGTVDANWMLVIDDTTDVIAADFEDMASGLNHPVYGATPITNDVWHHAAATYDGNTWKLYLDGNLETALVVGAAPRSDTTQHASLGTMLNTTGGTNGFFQGVLDEARVWNRALTQTEILSNINQELTNGAGLVARWGLNEGLGTAVGDSVAPAANGTVTGNDYAWVPGAPFDLDLVPDPPTLVAPVDGGTGVSTSPTLSVNVVDSHDSDLTVSFYGRVKNGSLGEDFDLIAIPDPQYYASTYPSIYNAQMNWVVAEKISRNIKYVMSLGDNVNTYTSTTEWNNAVAAWDILTAGLVPYGMVLGNHDGAPSNTANFNTYFGSRVSTQPTYAGRYGTSDYDNTFSTFSAGGMDFIVLFIEYDSTMTSSSNPVLAWADGILQANPTRRAIVVTHDLLSGNNFTNQGAAIYEALKENPNLFLMLGGHLDTTGQRVDVYNGHTVYSLRSDYQFVDSQQSGYLRIMRFSPTDSQIHVSTYSPTQDSYLTDAGNQFDLNYAMDGVADFSLIDSVTVPSGSDASVTWSGLAASTDYEWYAVSDNGGAAAVGSTWSFTTTGTPNHPPVVTDPGPQSNAEGEAVSLQIQASDEDPSDTLTYSASGLPSGLSINPTTGLIGGALDYLAANASPYSVTATASDGTEQDSVVFSWTVAQAASGLCDDDPNLVGCWPMEEGGGTTLVDATSFGNDGAITGSPTWGAGYDGQALHLSGTGQYAAAPDDPSLDISDQITLAAWIKPEKTAFATQYILKKAIMNSSNGYELSLASSGKVFTRFNQAASGNIYRIDSTTSYPLNGTAWMHIATTYDGANIRLYVDGVEEAFLPASITISTNSTDLGIGAQPDGTSPFQGLLDDVRVYNRALSAAEIQLLAGNAPTCYTLTLASGANGGDPTASPAKSAGCPADGQYAAGELIDLSAHPDPGYQVASWSGTNDDSSTALTNQLSMQAGNRSVTVTYEAASLGLSCTPLTPLATSANTGEKPQSKVWTYAGEWWTVLPASTPTASSNGTFLWRLDGSAWTEVLKLSNNTGSMADVKVDGSAAHILVYSGTGTELVSVEYNGGSYQAWSIRPAASPISLSGSETATIDIDSTGRMWLATENASNEILVYHSASPYTTWESPVVLATGVNSDDISVVTAMPGNKVGVLWSNQATKRFGFRVHADGADPNTWSADEVPASQSAIDNVGAGMADDHLNVAVASDGTLYAAVKTGYDTGGYPKIALLVRRPDATWDDLYSVDESGTRGIIQLDEANGVLTLIYTSAEGFNDMVYKQSGFQAIAFGDRVTLSTDSVNDSSGSKQNYAGEFVTIFHSASQVYGAFCSSGTVTSADLSISKDDGLATANSGDPTTYTITVSNNGPDDVTGATVTDAFSTNLSGVTWTCSASGGASCTGSGSGDIDDTVDIQNGESVTYTVAATFALGAQGTISNTASVAVPLGVIDPIPANNSATDTTDLPAADSLVAYFAMEEGGGTTLSDSSTYGNDGALYGAPAWVTSQPGLGLALELNQGHSGDFALVPDDPSLDIANQITLAAWIKPQVVGTQDLIAKLVGNGNEAFELDLSASGYAFAEFNGGNRANAVTLYSQHLNEWAHVAVTYDGAVVRLYVNGIEEATASGVFTISTNDQPLGVGSDSIGDRQFNGQMDEVRVYNRALDATEIATLASLPPEQSADLAISKDNGQTVATPGDPVTYTIVVSNNGPDGATGATVSDIMPADLTGVTWTCAAAGGGTCTGSGSGDIEDTVNLPNGSSLTYTVNGTFDAGATGLLANTASVALPAGMSDPLPGDNTATDIDLPSKWADLCGNDPNLVGCWLMEEASGDTIYDASGHGNHGTLYNDASRVAGQAGYGQALALDGAGDYALIPDDDSLDLATNLTIAAWFKPEKVDTQDLIKKAVMNTTDGYELTLATVPSAVPPEGDGRPFARFNQATSDNTYRINAVTAYPTSGSEWIHLAVTYDGAEIRMYYNGVLESTLPATLSIPANDLPLGIGAQSDGARQFQGQIDEVRLYNRALNPAEVQALAGVIPPTCYTLTLTSGPNGADPSANPLKSAECASDGQYVEGELIDLTAHPDAGYHVAAWSGTDDDLSTALTNQVSMPASDHSVEVTYTATAVLGEPVGTLTSWDGSFNWTGVSGATWYYLGVENESGGLLLGKWYTAESICMGQDCSVIPAELVGLVNGLYRWQVQDYGPYGYGVMTGLQEFTLDLAPAMAVLGEPSGTLTSWDGSFNWTGVASATWYYLGVENEGGGLLLGKWYPTESICTGLDCSVIPAELAGLANGLYRWRVQDYGPYGYGVVTGAQEFTLDLPPAVVELGEPSGTLTSWDGSFNWMGVSGATWYYLGVENESGSLMLGKWYAADGICTGLDCSVIPSELAGLVNGLYRWQVQDYGLYGYGVMTGLQEFTLDLPPAVVELGEPEGTLTSWDGSFNWTGVSGATWYYLGVENESGSLMLGKWYAADSICTGLDCSVIPSELAGLVNGLYRWQVQDYGPYGYGVMTGLQEFTLDLPPAMAVLGDPTGTLTSWDGSFNWMGVSGATWYYLGVENESGSLMLGKWYPAESICVGQDCSVIPAELAGLANGLYRWQVQDYGPYGYGVMTGLQEFTLNH